MLTPSDKRLNRDSEFPSELSNVSADPTTATGIQKPTEQVESGGLRESCEQEGGDCNHEYNITHDTYFYETNIQKLYKHPAGPWLCNRKNYALFVECVTNGLKSKKKMPLARYNACQSFITCFRNMTGIPFEYVLDFIDETDRNKKKYERLLDLFFKWSQPRWVHGKFDGFWRDQKPKKRKRKPLQESQSFSDLELEDTKTELELELGDTELENE